MSKKTWKMTLNYRIISANTILRQHWATRRRNRVRLWELVEEAEVDPVPHYKGRVYVEIKRQFGKRCSRFDRDNLYASCKVLLDCLKKPRGRSKYGLGIIEDDSPSHIKLVCKQEKSSDGIHRVVVTVKGNVNND